MITTLDCIPCYIRQSLQVIRSVTGVEADQQKIMKKCLQQLATLDFSLTPPAMSEKLYRILREETGISDPYKEEKSKYNRTIMSVYSQLWEHIQTSPDPFLACVNLAIAGNIIDLGALDPSDSNNKHMDASVITTTLFECEKNSLHGDISYLYSEIRAAKSILYLCDNAGEIVTDKLFMQHLQDRNRLQIDPVQHTIVAAVRGEPIINDATLEDADNIQLHKVATVISNGSGAPGTLLENCSDEFLSIFEKADVIIAKGQGNFESLNTVLSKNIFFLFKAKCQPIANACGFPIGSHLVLHT